MSNQNTKQKAESEINNSDRYEISQPTAEQIMV